MNDLKTTIKHYEERRQFYAWEVYNILFGQHYQTSLDVLRCLGQEPGEVSLIVLIAHMGNIADETTRRGKSIRNVFATLRALADQGLVKRRRHHDRFYIYSLSELGELVLICDKTQNGNFNWKRGSNLVSDPNGNETEQEFTSTKRSKKHTKHDWPMVIPQVRQLQTEGHTLRVICKMLDIPWGSLSHELYKC